MSNSPIKKIKPLGFPWETQDPFLFCVHHEDFYPEGNEEMGPATSLAGRNIGQDFTIKDGFRMYHGRKVPGFPAHPHRGFETVTIVRKGWVDHSDSMGASGRFGNGDVQWMTAGKGVQHSEMFPLLNQDDENPFELFQIWLNLPKSQKFTEPHFAMLWGDTIPKFIEKDANGKQITLAVMAGYLKGHQAPPPAPNSWAANDEHEVAIWTIKMESGASWTIPPASEEVNRSLYFFKGKQIAVGSEQIGSYQLIELQADQEILLENGEEEGELLLLQGKPINEPVVQYGPFVMNSQIEIQQAMQDYQRTQFGGWPWEVEQVHPRSKSRFAKYADGTEELRDR